MPHTNLKSDSLKQLYLPNTHFSLLQKYASHCIMRKLEVETSFMKKSILKPQKFLRTIIFLIKNF